MNFTLHLISPKSHTHTKIFLG